MTRSVMASISFEFSEENLAEFRDVGKEDITDQELIDWARDTFIDDIHNLVKFNQVLSAVQTNLWISTGFPHEHPVVDVEKN